MYNELRGYFLYILKICLEVRLFSIYKGFKRVISNMYLPGNLTWIVTLTSQFTTHAVCQANFISGFSLKWYNYRFSFNAITRVSFKKR
ncbi:hypothetical protein MBAV_003187 [Candidatus Magnetobacterium bavaricum]|uniref:Uncharacterized protein n=1 Tax=Candidatus Magnetobacterium bavaricum TaxID=29290 RepID=A0A0F3GRT9_9BACT|nr:hypothetical protein MBAV_003187 [Candidatus Magnetobacterium bavaricum]